MSGGDVLAIVAATAIAVATVALLFTMAAAVRAIGVFRKSVQEVTSRTLPVIADMHVAIKQANSDLMKVDGILDNAESISTTVDTASRLAYTAISTPVVKSMALGAGLSRFFRWIFHRKTA